MQRFRLIKWLGVLLFFPLLLSWHYAFGDPVWVEQQYSQFIYPLIITQLAAISSVFPIAMHEIVLALLLLILCFLLYKDYQLNKTWQQRLISGCLSVISMLSWTGLLLILFWGLNHKRMPAERIFSIGMELTHNSSSK